MRQAVTYKPSNTFSFGGFILMFISMLAAGVLMSWLYVILQEFIPIIYLCILITLGFGAAIGGIGALFVKIYKIRYPILAIIATLIAMLFVYLFHWCVYVSRDYDKNIYEYMKQQKASDYYIGMTDSEMEQWGYEEIVADLKNSSVRELTFTSQQKDYFTTEEQKAYDRGASIWEFYDFDTVLGKDVDEAVASLKAMNGKNAYTFYYEYRNQPKHTISYLLVHPGKLWEDIRNINKVGRWTMKSSRSSYSSSRNSTSNTNVNGIMLWIAWLGELLMMFLPAAAIVAARAGTPFIEQDNDWAITDKTQLSFKFVDPYPGNNAGEKQFKSVFMNDIDSLFSLQPLLPQMGPMNTYYTVRYCHSRTYDENYIDVQHTKVTNARNNQRATVTIAKKIRVDADYIATLHGMFNYPVPAGCNGVNRFNNANASEEQPQQEQQAQQQYAHPQQDYQQAQQQYAQPQQNYQQAQQQYAQPQQNYQQAQQQYSQPQQNYQQAQQQYAQPQQNYQQAQQQYTQPQQNYQAQSYQQPADNFGSGDMDGIDTSNIDLSSLDNMNH